MAEPVFEFQGDLTIYQAQSTREQLFTAWGAGVRRFDARQLDRLDGSGVQLLIALVKTAHQQQAPIEWLGWSPEALEALELMGCHHLLQQSSH